MKPHNYITATEAAEKIKSGMRVALGHAAACPSQVVRAMVDCAERYEGVEIVHMLAMGSVPHLNPGLSRHIRHNALFVGPSARELFKNNEADYTPCYFYEVPNLMRSGAFDIDVAIVQLTPPNAEGYMNFGVSSDYTKEIAHTSKCVIAEVNPKLPWVFGDNQIHISEIDYCVEVDYALPQLTSPVIGPTERAIGEHCASIVQDGDTLQLGIGAIPDAVLGSLTRKKHLGLHTEMFSDGVIDLVKKGVIDNSLKTLHPGKMIATFVMGSQALYDFVNQNPMVELHPVNYVNHPTVIMKNDNLVSINSCIQVDLMGQVASETIGFRQFSGVGGQVDYIRGAAMAKNGRSILAMPSTASNGSISRIAPILDVGSAVTTNRNDVHYVVTEYGIANLKGKSLRQRALALIEIAHPHHKASLIDAFEERFFKGDDYGLF